MENAGGRRKLKVLLIVWLCVKFRIWKFLELEWLESWAMVGKIYGISFLENSGTQPLYFRINSPPNPTIQPTMEDTFNKWGWKPFHPNPRKHGWKPIPQNKCLDKWKIENRVILNNIYLLFFSCFHLLFMRYF